ncbi:MAG TPA: DJ-1/PfpI family protein [Burkholderiales bacterium]|nr:DJ-1/PfpI family protein [Burkholderiales bacterium]
MKIAILTFDGFNEIDSFVSFHILSRIERDGWKVAIACPSETVQSTNRVRISAQQPLEFANDADAVLFGGSPRSREIAEEKAIMSRLKLDPRRQLIGSQCAGAWFLATLGLLATRPVCTTLRSRPALEAMGIRVLDRPFVASGNVASAGGCLASPYLAAWVMLRLAGREAAETALGIVAPVGEKKQYVAGILGVVSPFATADAESVAAG